jgi:hypothetical protein
MLQIKPSKPSTAAMRAAVRSLETTVKRVTPPGEVGLDGKPCVLPDHVNELRAWREAAEERARPARSR